MPDVTSERVRIGGLSVDARLHRFIEDEVLVGLEVAADAVWAGLDDLVHDLGPRSTALVRHRAELQAAIDGWLLARRGKGVDSASYRDFLTEIGYLHPAGADFSIDPIGIDTEIASVPGPQLVVPVTNARYALNAANARWGSLYDALYGTDALGDRPGPGPYDPVRGERVVAWVRDFLDDVVPLDGASHADVVAYRVEDGCLVADLRSGGVAGLVDPRSFAGHVGRRETPAGVLLRHHGLHLELVVDRHHPVGRVDAAGIADVVLESAVTTIVDFEDSVATVDAEDKVAAYRNWLGLMRGDLTAEVPGPGGTKERALADDRRYTAPDGATLVLPGRALLLVRNVGLLLTTDAVLDREGRPAPEGLLDALVTVLIALHDLRSRRSSRAGSVYVVKPKLHGPEEVAFTDEVFTRVESILGLPTGTVKVGLMDEERRTSANLEECIRAVRHRLAFVNTGFLDRTGDEIHTWMAAGPVVAKGAMKAERWFATYEDRNVAIGLACGLHGRAQIGKGMWAAPDRMADMLADKITHPRAGASCAWVPSPTAATLHATHYHRVDVLAVQAAMLGTPVPPVDDLLVPPLASAPPSADELVAELENNVQGILGYVVRWIDQGVGCSKVPDIHDVGLMEDRATCRISSQHLANWLRHGLLDPPRVAAALDRMAAVVDRQNEDDPGYVSLLADPTGPAFQAARDLVFSGAEQPNGYTELILHARRRQRKALLEVAT